MQRVTKTRPTAAAARRQPDAKPRPAGAWRVWLAAALLASCTLAVFSRALDCDWVNLDDKDYVTDNVRVAPGMSLQGAGWAFTTVYNANWHPLTWLSLQLDAALSSRKPDGSLDARGFHLTNILIHSANAALLFLALRALTGAYWRSVAVALLFAVHPLRVESVAWVSERKDVLSCFFGFLALWAYAAYVAAPSMRRSLAVAVLFALSLMCKPMLVTLPFLLLVLDWWPLGRLAPSNWERLLVEKLRLFALAVASAALTFYAQHAGGAVGKLDTYPVAVRVENAAVSYVAYLEKTFYPVGLSAFYTHLGTELPPAQAAGSAVLLAALTAGAVALRRRAPYLLAGWLWYLGTLVPVIGIVQVGNQAMADRYTYFPQIGVLIALCWGIGDLARMRARWAVPAVAAAAGAAAVTLSVLTWNQVAVWDSSVSLWAHALLVTDRTLNGLLFLGGSLEDAGMREDAERCYREILAKDPDSVRALTNLGNLYAWDGDLEKATRLLTHALEIDPKDGLAHSNYGFVLLQQGKIDDAIREQKTAVELNPAIKGAYVYLGMAEEKKKDAQKAEEYYREALSLDPNFAEAHTGLGNVLRRLGRDKEALGHLQAGVRYKPDYAEAHNDLGKALVDRGDIDGAARQFEAAQRLKPGLAPAWYNLGAARLRQNRYEEGLDCLMEAVKLASAQHDPNVEEYQKQLDTVRKRLQDFGQTDLIRRVEERRAKRTPPSPRPGATTS